MKTVALWLYGLVALLSAIGTTYLIGKVESGENLGLDDFLAKMPWTLIITSIFAGFVVYGLAPLLPRRARGLLYIPFGALVAYTAWEVYVVGSELAKIRRQAKPVKHNIKSPPRDLGVGYVFDVDRTAKPGIWLKIKYTQKYYRDDPRVWAGIHLHWEKGTARVLEVEKEAYMRWETGECDDSEWLEVYNLRPDDEVRVKISVEGENWWQKLKAQLWWDVWVRCWAPLPYLGMDMPKEYLYQCEDPATGETWYDRQRYPKETPCYETCHLPRENVCPVACWSNHHRVWVPG